MIEPKPGEAFEYAGLRWEWRNDGRFWMTQIGGSHAWLDPPNAERIWGTESTHMVVRTFPTAEDAIRWTIRTCRGATCSTCRQYCGDLKRCVEDCFAIADGFCHLWMAKECDE